jgi:hypothetical protein
MTKREVPKGKSARATTTKKGGMSEKAFINAMEDSRIRRRARSIEQTLVNNRRDDAITAARAAPMSLAEAEKRLEKLTHRSGVVKAKRVSLAARIVR